jgi:hypothetical protein
MSAWHIDVHVLYLDTKVAIAARGGSLYLSSSAPLQKGNMMRRLTLLAMSPAVAALLLMAVEGNLRLAHALTVVPQGFTQTQITAAKAFDNPHEAVR